MVFPDGYTENLQVHHSPAQRWFYLENQEVDEVLVFRQAFSHPEERNGGFDLDDQNGDGGSGLSLSADSLG